MSEERKTKTDAAAPASAALERIDRKDAFLQALHTFLTAHQGTEWAVAAVDIQHFKLYNELYGTEKGDALLETVANCLLGYSKQTGYPVGYFGNDDFFLCLPDEKAEQTAVLATLQACMNAGRQDVTFFVVMGVCPMQANPGADAATLCNYAQIAGVTTDSGYLHRFEPTMLNELKEQQQLLGELACEALLGNSGPLYARLYREGLVNRNFSYGYESYPGCAFLCAGGESKDPEGVRAAVAAEAERIAREGIDLELWERLKKSSYGNRVRALNSFEHICISQAQSFFQGCDFLRFPEVYDSLTREDAQAMIARWVTPERTALSVVRPREEAVE